MLGTSNLSGVVGGGGGGSGGTAGVSGILDGFVVSNKTSTTTAAMSGGAIAQLPPPPPPRPVFSPFMKKPQGLSLSFTVKMEGNSETGMIGEPFDQVMIGKMRDDGYESRSGSDNFDGASGDDQDAGGEDRKPKRKKYHRHTSDQIQELEAFFKDVPHPDEKQRTELSRRLGLESKQIKFWFQNKRTQMKTQLERHENVILRQENDKLRAENEFLKQNISDPICSNCGGAVVPGPVSMEQQHLRIENARLSDELNRVRAIVNKFMGGRQLLPSSSSVPPFGAGSNLELAVGRNGFGGYGNLESSLPLGLDYTDALGTMPLMKQMAIAGGNEAAYDKSVFMELAFAAMDELIKKAHVDSPLWIKSFDGSKEILSQEEYMRSFPPCIGMKPGNFVFEASRETGIIVSTSLALVETLMDVNLWAETFTGIVARAATMESISGGIGGTKNGTAQAMIAEFQVISPLVPHRQVKFLRFCKQHAEGVWAVVDVSLDALQETSNAHTFSSCRRLPSGCILQDMPNGCTKVTWVEHWEYDESAVHQIYRTVISSGRGFGAQRWMGTLQRHCECMALLMSSSISGEDQTGITLSGKKSLLKLAQRMVDNFCSGIGGSSVLVWENLSIGDLSENVKIMTRKTVNDLGEPTGIMLSAATSVWLPVPRQRLFDFLSNERSRGEWDILTHGGVLREMVHISKGQARGNAVSLLRSNILDDNGNENNVIVLQETWYDASSSLVVSAPVDVASMSVVMNGGDSAYVSIMPSGFMIFPDDTFHIGGASNGTKSDSDGSSEGGASVLTVSFQMVGNKHPGAKITVQSVETVNNLLTGTIHRIRAALHLN